MVYEFDLNGAVISKLITHQVGNKLREEGVRTFERLTEIDEATSEYLLTYLLKPFKPEEIQCFTHAIDRKQNDVLAIAERMFEQQESFIAESINLAKLLYEATHHPQIKDGKLNVVYFSDIRIEDELLDGIGLFKSENDVPFLKMNSQENHYQIVHEFGFDLNGVDKGCLILNTDPSEGYDVLVVDNSRRSVDAQYWVHDFLNVTPKSNEYNQTKDVLTFTKEFVVKELKNSVEKTDRINLLNRTMEYFGSNDQFDKENFEHTVLQQPNLIEAFNQYEENKEDTRLNNHFGISHKAVEQQSRKFKSVLKLDKNFHVYIHGGKDLIEKGVDSDGRKYYKIYYDVEK